MTRAKSRRPSVESLLTMVQRPFFVALLLLVGVYLVAPLVSATEAPALPAALGGLILWFGMATGLALATYASRSPRRIARTVVPLIAILTVLGFFSDPDPGASTTVQRALFAVLVVISTLVVLEFVIRAERVDADAIFASMCAYFLLALLWAFLYAAIDSALLSHGAASFEPEPPVGGETNFAELLYFSFVTLTTLGYGDMTPVHPVVRAFAAMEAFVGQMFLAILVARLVSLHLMDRTDIARDDG